MQRTAVSEHENNDDDDGFDYSDDFIEETVEEVDPHADHVVAAHVSVTRYMNADGNDFVCMHGSEGSGTIEMVGLMISGAFHMLMEEYVQDDDEDEDEQ